MSYYVEINNKIHKATCDIVPVIKLGCWPEEVERWWLSKEQRWPDDVTKRRIVSEGCFLVSRDPGDDKEAIRLQVSFFNAEIHLSSMWSMKQKLVYLLAKAVYYKRIIPLNSKDDSNENESKEIQLSSYFLKTAMMHLCDEHPPMDDFWNDINEAASHLLQTLAKNFEQGCLENYFLPNVNLLQKTSRNRLQMAAYVLQKVMYNPAAELADVVKELLDRVQNLNNYAQLAELALSSFCRGGSYDNQTFIDAINWLCTMIQN